MVIRESCRLADGVFVLPTGMRIGAPGITLDGGSATLVGAGRRGAGVTLDGADGVTLRGLRVAGFEHGIRASNAEGLSIEACEVWATAEVESNTIFLDIWRGPDNPYGSGILLDRVRASRVADCMLQHQQNGLLTYGCRNLEVRANNASYNSGFGFHLYATCDSVFEANCADYCCRFEPREGGRHFGHMGADAAGFVAVMGSSRNTFRGNAARLGGDGFFLAGLGPDGKPCGCDDNLFEGNDGSLSPNIAFEATFCRGNTFKDNHADRCNYGFWLGYSWDTIIAGNRMVMNRQAGIAVENGHGFRVEGNTMQANGHGVLIWTGHVPSFAALYPDSTTSHDWDIEGNVFTRNGKGIRIAADQDHGIRPAHYADGAAPPDPSVLRPRRHRIVGNDIQDNRVGIELHRADETTVERNILNRNVEADIREDDAADTLRRNNLGAAGAYL
jgi:parallel beta-helix repeat protein